MIEDNEGAWLLVY